METQKFQDSLNKDTIEAIERLQHAHPNEAVYYTKLVAIYVLLTSCCLPQNRDENPEYFDYHKRLSGCFKELASLVSDGVAPKHNFGRPLLRKPENSDPTILSGASGHRPSTTIWKLTECGATVEVPDCYDAGFKSALLFLLLNDVVDSFAMSELRAVEIPCFLEMFRNSSENNGNNIGALLGEFVALIKLCLREYPPNNMTEFFYCCHTTKYDFAIRSRPTAQNSLEASVQEPLTVVNVSVKSVWLVPARMFATQRRDVLWKTKQEREQRARNPKSKKKEPNGNPEFMNGSKVVNILLHNCDCCDCSSHPVRKITITGRQCDSGSRDSFRNCSRAENFDDMLQSLIQGTIYLVRADMFYELRYALMVDQKVFRSEVATTGFKLKDFTVWGLDPHKKQEKEISDPIRALIDRHCN